MKPLRFACLTAAAAFANPAQAADWSSDDFKLSLTGSVGIATFAAPGANFGGGSYDIRAERDFLEGRRADAGRPATAPVWFEGYIKPNLRMTRSLDDDHSLFADFSTVLDKTLGDGDSSVFSTTPGYPGSLAIEEAYVGYRGPPPFGLKGDSIVVQLGRQDFIIDDGFLVQLGRYSIGKSANVYMSPHTAFAGWGTVRINTDPVRADIFVLAADADNIRAYGDAGFAIDQPRTNFAGFDIEWFENAATKGANGAVNYLDRAKYLNLTYFNIYDADRNPALYNNDHIFWARREGLNVFSLAGGGNLIPLDALDLKRNGSLYFQYVRQSNRNPDRNVDATGYYIEPGYSFPDLPWSPRIYYRYMHLGGQTGPADGPVSTKHSYDFMFLGGGIRDIYGNYAIGEIVGNLMVPPSNLIAHSVAIKVTAPFHVLDDTDSLSFELLAYAFDLDSPEQAGATTANFAREIDLTAQYTFDEHTFAGFAAAVAIPEQGGRETIARLTTGQAHAQPIGENAYAFEFFVVRSF